MLAKCVNKIHLFNHYTQDLFISLLSKCLLNIINTYNDILKYTHIKLNIIYYYKKIII